MMCSRQKRYNSSITRWIATATGKTVVGIVVGGGAMMVMMIMMMVWGSMLFSPASALASTQPYDQGVVPSAGRPSTAFSFFATGFGDDERVAYWFNAPDGRIYAHDYRYRTYAYRGRADWKWRSPDGATPGRWTAVAEGLDSEVQRVVHFEILPPEQAPPDNTTLPTPSDDVNNQEGVDVRPNVGHPGTRFAFYATDFNDDERVAYWFNAPDGRIYAHDRKYAVFAYRGRADWRWTSPADAPPGMWTAVAKGDESGVERVILFEIRPTEQQIQPDEEPPPQNNETVAVEPTAGGPETRFAFFANGFLPRETVIYWVNSPTDQQYRKGSYRLRPNERGEVYWWWKTPPDAAAGIWRMRAMGEESQVQKVIYFTVQPVPPTP